jgi:serine/threonine-protein kinase
MPHRVSSGDDPYVGLVLGGQFRIEEGLAEGAMARVYRAHQLGVNRKVAVKILRRELLLNDNVTARFRSEAELVARLIHPHVVIVHAVGEVSEQSGDAGGEPYVAMELLEGPTLSMLLEKSKSLPIGRALHIVLSLADAVGEAHARGIVHRDLKPDNVMVVERGDDPDFVKLLDFGLSRTLRERPELRTREGAVLGTPRYLSPEGAEGRPVSPAADCYALATILYECLAGQTPFDGDSVVGLLSQQISSPAPDLRSCRLSRDVPEILARVIMQNLDKRPEARAPDARAFGRVLVDAARKANLDAEEFGLSATLIGTRKSLSPVLEAAASARPAFASKPSLAGPAGSSDSQKPVLSARASKRLASARPSFGLVSLVLACFLAGALAAAGVATSIGTFSPLKETRP